MKCTLGPSTLSTCCGFVCSAGLYGENGVLPARTQLEDKGRSLASNLQTKPTLLWLAPYVGLDTEYMMNALALMGMFLAFTGQVHKTYNTLGISGWPSTWEKFISQKFCTVPILFGLWSLYYSLYQVGQTFMWYQWDILLLEAGALCILVAPLRYQVQSRRRPLPPSPSDSVSFWLVRWLLFRLMFASGVVKLTSGCPTWWGLTALSVHFESQCLPTPLAWYAHHLPEWFLKLCTAHASIMEVGLPILFFFPNRFVRYTGFFLQLFLQACIILTGNYNFFNLLTMVLCVSLLDDEYFRAVPHKKNSSAGMFQQTRVLCQPVYKRSGPLLSVVRQCGSLQYKMDSKQHPGSEYRHSPEVSSRGDVTIDTFYSRLYICIPIILNGIFVRPGLDVFVCSPAFTKQEFDWALSKALPAVIYVGLSSLTIHILKAVMLSVLEPQTTFAKITTLLSTVFYSAAALFIFGISIVPFSTLHPVGNTTVIPAMREWHTRLDHLHLTNSYGLFRRMTGVGGRPEVIIVGSNNMEGPWKEYNFLYKPGNVNNTPPFVGKDPRGVRAPHQPRLDWQMWFAALGTYHQNPWLMSLTYRLLTGQKEVLNLLDTARNPFPGKPPKYIKANLYHYHYTPWSQRWTGGSWWTREEVREYFPIYSRDHAPLLDYLRNLKILPEKGAAAPPSKVNFVVRAVLDNLRLFETHVESSILLWSIFMAGCVIIATKSSSQPSRK
uniref:Lipase maturation factor n=1 Tax=Timema californicum TaxID=61474 RepID=A0A7R9PBI8_TIMCA|nr:unnamed protein product [Timema californicum]